MSKLDSQCSVVRWTWIVYRGSVADRELKDWAGTRYDRQELRESTASTRCLEYIVEGRLVVDGPTPSPDFVFFY